MVVIETRKSFSTTLKVIFSKPAAQGESDNINTYIWHATTVDCWPFHLLHWWRCTSSFHLNSYWLSAERGFDLIWLHVHWRCAILEFPVNQMKREINESTNKLWLNAIAVCNVLENFLPCKSDCYGMKTLVPTCTCESSWGESGDLNLKFDFTLHIRMHNTKFFKLTIIETYTLLELKRLLMGGFCGFEYIKQRKF